MNAMIQNIERRIASWSQIPESHGEPIQVLRYKPGEEYRAHYDYFFHDAGKLNNRVATVLMYLSDVEVRSSKYPCHITFTSISCTVTDSITESTMCAC
jgi:prolyl 4-hydroxylase